MTTLVRVTGGGTGTYLEGGRERGERGEGERGSGREREERGEGGREGEGEGEGERGQCHQACTTTSN